MQSSFSKSLNKNNPAEANLHTVSVCTKTGNDFVKLQKKVGVKEQLVFECNFTGLILSPYRT